MRDLLRSMVADLVFCVVVGSSLAAEFCAANLIHNARPDLGGLAWFLAVAVSVAAVASVVVRPLIRRAIGFRDDPRGPSGGKPPGADVAGAMGAPWERGSLSEYKLHFLAATGVSSISAAGVSVLGALVGATLWM